MNEKTLDNRCPSCAAPIFFKPTLGKWKCDYCDSVFTLEQLQKFNNASNTKVNSNTEQTEINYVSYTCKDCGAEIIADEQTAATFCVYCGNTAILKNKLSGEFRPSKIIPFKVEKEVAIESFKGISKGRPLMPKMFNKIENIEKIRGIYIPFWLYDINVAGSLNADGEKISVWISDDRQFTKVDFYKIYRTATMDYLKIPVDGSTRFDDDMMSTIEPFNYEELVDYNHAYLSGFFAEKYDVDNEKAYSQAGQRALDSTYDDMKKDMGNFMNKSVFENTLAPRLINSEYVMLPVWMVNVKYKSKNYLFAMNGETGEFVGNIPVDEKKAFIMSIIIFISIFIISIGISYIMYLVGV